MKKIILLTTIYCLIVGLAMAQSFTDDFESYVADSTVGTQSPQWTTWSKNDGSEEDVNVVTTKAHSGTKSLYFSSTNPVGGPIDCVLPFGGIYQTGKFTFKAWFYVEAGKTAYFNFQGDSVMGKTYAIDCYMMENGVLNIQVGGVNMISSTYTQDTWFELKIDINLNTSLWNVYLNGVSAGTFNNKIFQVASIDLYPADDMASYWVDDVAYNYEAYTFPSVNGALLGIQVGKGISGQKRTPSVVVRNMGTQPITSYDITYRMNGITTTQPVNGVNIAPLTTATVVASGAITLLPGNNIIEARITNVNGAFLDGDQTDDSLSNAFKAPQPAAGKMVIAEEATGTWCGYCPRGAVALRNMQEYKGYFAGIAVHNNDPMEHVSYDSAIATLIQGYPAALVDRGNDIDPLGIEDVFLKNIAVAPKALLVNGAIYDNATRQLKVSITTTFQQAVSGDYRIACVLTEDSVTGTAKSYDQRNYYANNKLGPMGGFELLSDPVPASEMVYDHVARQISPSFSGYQNSFPASVSAGSVYTLNFVFSLPAEWKDKYIHIVGMFIDPAGKIDNASSTTIAQAVKNGFVNGTVVTGIITTQAPDIKVNLYPNPVSDMAFIDIQMENESTVSLEVYNITGSLIASKNYAKLNGNQTVPVYAANLESGVYIVKVYINGKPTVTRFVKQ